MHRALGPEVIFVLAVTLASCLSKVVCMRRKKGLGQKIRTLDEPFVDDRFRKSKALLHLYGNGPTGNPQIRIHLRQPHPLLI